MKNIGTYISINMISLTNKMNLITRRHMPKLAIGVGETNIVKEPFQKP